MFRTFQAGITAATLTVGAALTAGAAPVAAAPTRAPTPAAGMPAAGMPAVAGPTFDRLVAYVRGGNIYTSKAASASEWQLTRGGGHSRPRWSPDGRRIAYLRNGLLHVMNADGGNQHRLTARPAAGPAWSPDGRWIAFASAGCIGGPSIYRISSSGTNAPLETLFPVDCRDQAPPPVTAAPAAPAGTLVERLRHDDAVAWSPDGARIAFRGGECESVFDACLSLGTVATGGERLLAGYGGGGQEYSGFAVLPWFRPDGAKVSWTAYQVGHNPQTTLPVHIVEYDLIRGTQRRVGVSQDRELVYQNSSRALVAGEHRNAPWVIAVNLGTGARSPFRPGTQPAIQPAMIEPR